MLGTHHMLQGRPEMKNRTCLRPADSGIRSRAENSSASLTTTCTLCPAQTCIPALRSSISQD